MNHSTCCFASMLYTICVSLVYVVIFLITGCMNEIQLGTVIFKPYYSAVNYDLH